MLINNALVSLVLSLGLTRSSISPHPLSKSNTFQLNFSHFFRIYIINSFVPD